eukprot:INCI19095.12.p1 GENE.INCI19095.12~~INCI19095.12.p1  ORF type:complete len:486 (-),score=66.50 INCI19095.12:1118-2575(-)
MRDFANALLRGAGDIGKHLTPVAAAEAAAAAPAATTTTTTKAPFVWNATRHSTTPLRHSTVFAHSTGFRTTPSLTTAHAVASSVADLTTASWTTAVNFTVTATSSVPLPPLTTADPIPTWDRLGVLTVLTQVSASLSVLGALSIIVTFFAFTSLRQRRGRQLIFFLSVCDLLTAATYSFEPNAQGRVLSGTVDTDLLCRVQGVATIYFPVASFLWTLCISIFIYRNTPQPIKSFCVTYATFHAVCWVIPAILCVVVIANRREGANSNAATDMHNTGGWCWLNTTDLDPESRLMWELVGGKGVEITCILSVCVLYFLTARKFRANDMHELEPTLMPEDERTPERQNVQEFQRKMVLVPVFFVAARLWGSINTFLFAFAGPGGPGMDAFIGAMECLQAFCDPIQGFLNGILFVAFSVQVRLKISRHWCKPCRRKPRGIESTTPSLSSPNGDDFNMPRGAIPRLSDLSVDSHSDGDGITPRSRYDSDF